MKTINVHLVVVVSIMIALIVFNWQYGQETFVFFGFAENKEMEVRLEHPVTVGAIHVTPGSRVKKGDLLLEVTRSGIEQTQSDLNHEVARLESQLLIWEANLKSSLSRLNAQKVAQESDIKTQIDQLESEMAINKSLIQDLKSIQPAKDNTGRSPNEIRITGLKNELNLAVAPIGSEINRIRNELSAPNNPLRIQINQLKSEIGFVNKEEEKLNVLAASDGVVGSIFCKTGEQMASFDNMITFYEENPTQVKGYVLENLILNVNMNDEIIVNSESKSSNNCIGRVIGMGSRIVEIPERLRKNPTFKTYGREILIKIPEDNTFLQSEKVVLKLPHKKASVSVASKRPNARPVSGSVGLVE